VKSGVYDFLANIKHHPAGHTAYGDAHFHWTMWKVVQGFLLSSMVGDTQKRGPESRQSGQTINTTRTSGLKPRKNDSWRQDFQL